MQNYLIGTGILVDYGEQIGSVKSLTPRTFIVDRKERETDTAGDGIYLLHGSGDASLFAPGGSLYTPDGIIWDIVAIDADRQGLTVSKRRDDVSLTAWLFGDWSRLTGDVPYKPPSLARDAAMAAREGAHNVKEGVKKYLPWVIGGTFAVGFLVVAAPIATQLLTRRSRW